MGLQRERARAARVSPVISRSAAPHRVPRSRRVAVVGLALAASLGLGACQMTSPVTTDLAYDPADGVSVDAGDLAVRDLLVVSEGGGAPGVVSGLVVNNGTQEAQVTVIVIADGQMTPLSPTVTVPADGAVRLDGIGVDGSGQAVSIPSVTANPGGTVEITVQSDGGVAGSGLAPVLAPDGYYIDHVATTSDVSN